MVATSTNTLDVEGLRPWSGPWLIVEEGNVIGGVGFMGAPENGALEVGYGIVPSVRGRGVATIAVAKLIELAGQAVPLIVAETTVTNVASHGVLRRLRFLESGRRFDKGDGDLIVWSRATFPGS